MFDRILLEIFFGIGLKDMVILFEIFELFLIEEENKIFFDGFDKIWDVGV